MLTTNFKELGRGTSTFVSRSFPTIAAYLTSHPRTEWPLQGYEWMVHSHRQLLICSQAVLHHLATHTLALSCFATHYSSLTDDFAYHPNIRNMHMQTMVDDEKREVLDYHYSSLHLMIYNFLSFLAAVPI